MNDSRVIVALDHPDAGAALAMVDALDPADCALKIGKELFTAAGPDLVRACVARGFRVFLDLKFHDIPNTVAGACAAATRLGVWMLNVHAAGGAAMMSAARNGVERAATERGQPLPLLIGVTVLTSLDAQALATTGVADSPATQVLRLARLAKASGLDGVVASAHEASALRSALGPGFKLVIPGIRPADAAMNDQSRVATPEIAVAQGADYLVIGRPITQSRDPAETLRAIRRSLGEID